MYIKIPAGKHLMDLVAVDWFKDTKRMDHVARRQGCAAKVRSSAFPSLLFLLSFFLFCFSVYRLAEGERVEVEPWLYQRTPKCLCLSN